MISMRFLEAAKSKVWRHRFQKSEDLCQDLEVLLLEKLSEVGEITEDDIAWAQDRVREFKT